MRLRFSYFLVLNWFPFEFLPMSDGKKKRQNQSNTQNNIAWLVNVFQVSNTNSPLVPSDMPAPVDHMEHQWWNQQRFLHQQRNMVQVVVCSGFSRVGDDALGWVPVSGGEEAGFVHQRRQQNRSTQWKNWSDSVSSRNTHWNAPLVNRQMWTHWPFNVDLVSVDPCVYLFLCGWRESHFGDLLAGG